MVVFFRCFSGQRKRRNEIFVWVRRPRDRHRHQRGGSRRAAPPLNRCVGPPPHLPSRVGSSSATALTNRALSARSSSSSPSENRQQKNPRWPSIFAGVHFRRGGRSARQCVYLEVHISGLPMYTGVYLSRTIMWIVVACQYYIYIYIL